MSVTDVPGFVASGLSCGIKSSNRPDLALIASEDRTPVTAAGVFTRNKMTAAPVTVSRHNLARSAGRAAAVIINSGNANAATGPDGMRDAAVMASQTAKALDVDSHHVLVCSTGLIGFPLPMEAIESGIPHAVEALSPDGGLAAATAMLTTDSREKLATVTADVDGLVTTFGGIAKGSAMLEPNMATMLSVITTDAALTPDEASGLLVQAVESTFNRLTVDGAESTNDTVLLLANGRAGRPEDIASLLAPLTEVCTELAVMMADDAEGSTKTVFITVSGASSDADAATVARSIANCQLIKCSWYGKDPYWGRIAAEAGSAAEAFSPDTLTISYGGIPTFEMGKATEPETGALAEVMNQRRLDLDIDLGQGPGRSQIVTTDLTHAYIDENMGTS